MSDATDTGLTRRHALSGTALAAVGLPVLAACGDDGGGAAGPGGSGSSSAAGSGSGLSGALASTSDIPEGGGAVFADEGVVVTQPTAGEFKAFSSTCTHQGCAVSGVTSTIDCACHGSRFGLADGAPESGPATEPLREVAISVEDGRIVLG